MTPKLPLKFILLWVINLALLLVLTLTTGFWNKIQVLQIQNTATLYLVVAFLLAGLEQALWDKLRGND